MLTDLYNREINYLRLSITDLCNLQCSYCYPNINVCCSVGGSSLGSILTYDEILSLAKVSVELGITKIRLTGGEPLLRDDVVSLVSAISHISGIDECVLTTNGVLLQDYAEALKRAGLCRINVSLDSLREDTYLQKVLGGIYAAKRFGLPVKINFVVLPEVNDGEVLSMKRFCQMHGLGLQFIKKMDLERGKDKIEEEVFYDRPPSCRMCNKIRVTSRGDLLPCLFGQAIGNIRMFNNIKEAIVTTVINKKKHGQISDCKLSMLGIGG